MQFKPDKLTVPERMGAILTRQKPDRVPFIPFIFGFCSRNVGYPVAAVYEDAEKSFWSQIWTQMQYDYDGGALYGYASVGGWEFGGDIKFPRSEWEQAPVVTRFPIETEEDVVNFKVPKNVMNVGANPIMVQFNDIQAKMGMPLMVQFGGPFTFAGNCVEVDLLLRWMIKRKDIAHLLMKKVNQFLIEMVTGIGFCGRRGQRKRERQLRKLSDHPELFHFYPPPRTTKRKIVITDIDGKKTVIKR